MSRDKGEARTVLAQAYLLTDLSTRPRHQTLASLQAFPADRRYSTYMKPMRTDALQTFFVDAAMLAFPHRRRRSHEGPAAHAAMLEMNNSYTSGRPARSSALSRISPRVRVRDSDSIVYRIAPGGYSWIWPRHLGLIAFWVHLRRLSLIHI